MNNIKVNNLKGEKGGYYVADTGTYLGDFGAIYAHAAAVVTVISPRLGTGISNALTTPAPDDEATIASVPIPAGSTWFGKFSSVAVASGKITLYLAD